jgi:hypothetical protein
MAFDSLREFYEDKALVARVGDLLSSREMRAAVQVSWNTFTQRVRGDEAAARIAGARDYLDVLENICNPPKPTVRADYNLTQ